VKKNRLISIIEAFVAGDKGNKLPGKNVHVFEKPIVAFASADDPLFVKLKEPDVVGPTHTLPTDWVSDANTVISYFLPINNQLVETNYSGTSSSEDWVYVRFYGEDFNNRLRQVIVSTLQAEGYSAVAPLISSGYSVKNFRSNWSERHVAFIAGIGSFGLNRGIITEKGLAGRLGSVITNLVLEPTVRTYKEINERCPWYDQNKCGECIKRCPSGALTPEGKDIAKCDNFLKNIEGEKIRAIYGFPFSPCGKCFVNVPCESQIPER
jgi:epoxyqueuosine reductase